MGDIEIPKQIYLTDFIRIPEADIVVWKHVAAVGTGHVIQLSLIHISEPTRLRRKSRMPSSA